MNDEQERKVLRLAGLGVRARNAVVGVEQVRRAAERGRLRLGLVAADASNHSRAKIVPLLGARGVPMVEMPSAERLGAIAGRASTAVVGVLDPRLARGMTEVLGVTRAARAVPDDSVGGIA